MLLASFGSKVFNTSMNQTHAYLERWHQGLKSQEQDFLDEILDDSCIFRSPIVFKPIEGKEMSKLYLMGAGQTFDMERFQYVRELVDGLDCMLEFETYIGDISINGVDIITFNSAGQISEFKVMIRPLQAVQIIHEQMQKMLNQFKENE